MYKTANPPVTIQTIDFIAALSDEQMINILCDPQDPAHVRFYLNIMVSGEVKTDRDLAGLNWLVDTVNMLTEAQVDAFFGFGE